MHAARKEHPLRFIRMIQRFLMGIIRVLNFILVATIFAITAIPFIIYAWFFMRCTACGKRGTIRFEKTTSTKTEQNTEVLNNSCFCSICRNCGNVRVRISGTWYDVRKDGLVLVNGGILENQIGDKTKEHPHKRVKSSLRKNKRKSFEQN